MKNSVSVHCEGSTVEYPLAELAEQAWATLGKEGFDTRDTYTDAEGDWRQGLELCGQWNPDGLEVMWRWNRRDAGQRATRESRMGVVHIARQDMEDLIGKGATLQQIVTAAGRQLARWKQDEGLPLKRENFLPLETRRFNGEVE